MKGIIRWIDARIGILDEHARNARSIANGYYEDARRDDESGRSMTPMLNGYAKFSGAADSWERRGDWWRAIRSRLVPDESGDRDE